MTPYRQLTGCLVQPGQAPWIHLELSSLPGSELPTIRGYRSTEGPLVIVLATDVVTSKPESWMYLFVAKYLTQRASATTLPS